MVMGVDIMSFADRVRIAGTPVFESIVVCEEYTGLEKTLPPYLLPKDYPDWNRKFYWRCIRKGNPHPEVRLLKEEDY